MGGAARFLMLLPPRAPSLLRLARHNHYRHYASALSSLSAPRDLTGFPRRVGSLLVKSSSSRQLHAQAATFRDDQFSDSAHPAPAGTQHPWPEWLNLLGNLSAGGYMRGESGAAVPDVGRKDEYAAGLSLPEDFLTAARACLAFARDRPHLLTALPWNDVEVVVNHGTPFLFNNGDDSMRRMRSFLNGSEGVVADSDKAETVDLMRFILSYASSPTTMDAANFSNQEIVAPCVRNLISELVKLTSPSSGPRFSDPVQNQFAGRYGQSSRPRGQNIEMKRGDWICQRCNFMNFARNMKCLECEEARPRRQLTGGEWDCPQCNFLNNGRNTACLRCDCKHPGGFSPISSGYTSGNNADRADLVRRLAANEEKAQRWFSKVSKLDSTSDFNSAADDEDFPEIMPLRKGVNRFVVSTRKTPLERRLANAEYRRNSSSDGSLSGPGPQTGNNVARVSTPPYPNSTQQQGYSRGSNPNYVPFVPLPADMFAKKPENTSTKDGNANEERSRPLSFNPNEQVSPAVDTPGNISGDRYDSRHEQFVVNRKEDRPFSSPTYKRRAALEQASNLNSNSNYVPFVPFPPDYFAKKDTQQQSNAGNSIEKSANIVSSDPTNHQKQNTENPEASARNAAPRPAGIFENSSNREEVTNRMSSSSDKQGPSYSWSGKSLEGSAVKEIDPLDMSEEAKAERWFRRVAQIKDISELSQIPDEDFPSIMPMRKGVNRFVVSKRKTPLERRLTSAQYRKNLPVVSSDPLKKDNEGQ